MVIESNNVRIQELEKININLITENNLHKLKSSEYLANVNNLQKELNIIKKSHGELSRNIISYQNIIKSKDKEIREYTCNINNLKGKILEQTRDIRYKDQTLIDRNNILYEHDKQISILEQENKNLNVKNNDSVK